MTNFSDLVGKTLIAVRQSEDEIWFFCSDGSEYRLWHLQDCCESVTIDDVSGDYSDLLGVPILVAEERSSHYEFGRLKHGEPIGGGFEKRNTDSDTWTFYTLRTLKGTVDVRWHGESSGYYCESVDFDCIREPGAPDG